MKKEFVRVPSTKDIVIFSLITIAGLLLLFVFSNTAIFMTGCFLIFVGVMLILFMKSGYQDVQSGYVKYTYESCTELYRHELKDVDKLIG